MQTKNIGSFVIIAKDIAKYSTKQIQTNNFKRHMMTTTTDRSSTPDSEVKQARLHSGGCR